MKKILAIFSVLAMFSVTAIAQDPPKKNNTVKPRTATAQPKTGKKIKQMKVVKQKAVKADAPANKISE